MHYSGVFIEKHRGRDRARGRAGLHRQRKRASFEFNRMAGYAFSQDRTGDRSNVLGREAACPGGAMGLAHTRGFEAQVTGMARKSSSGNRRPARGRSRTARRLGRGQAQATQARRIRIEVLRSALADLDHGRQFYGQQNVAVGDYFLDALFSGDVVHGLSRSRLQAEPREDDGRSFLTAVAPDPWWAVMNGSYQPGPPPVTD